MKLTSFSLVKRTEMIKTAIAFAVLIMVVQIFMTQAVHADSLTYSPDQWPRHWNHLINSSGLQGNAPGYNGRDASIQNNYKKPLRSQMWGKAPVKKRESRRSTTPEYNTHSHMRSRTGVDLYQNSYMNNSYYGIPAYGMFHPVAPYAGSYGASVLAPGFGAPAIPLSLHPPLYPPYGGLLPYTGAGLWPTTGYMW